MRKSEAMLVHSIAGGLIRVRRSLASAARVVVPTLVMALAVSAVPSPAHGQPSGAPRYQVYGVRFAGYHAFPVAELVAGADTTRRTDLAFIVWVLKGSGLGATGHTVLFDAGFYRDQFIKSWKPFDFVRPSEAIERVGVRAEDVTDVIISHVHWDHVDGADLFPHARVWLQRAEYEHYVGDDGRPRARGIDTVDAAMLAALHRAGRVHLIDGDAREVIPGITAYTGGRHTFASEYITVQTGRGTVVLASDNVYMYENIAKHAPIGATYTRADTASNLRAQERMLRLAADSTLVLPGHDPAIFVRFPTPGNGVAEIK